VVIVWICKVDMIYGDYVGMNIMSWNSLDNNWWEISANREE